MRLRAWLGSGMTVWALAAAPGAFAAEATDVLDAIDGDDLFDANVEISYKAHAKTAKIVREDVVNGQKVDVNEYLYFEHKHEMMPKLRVGIFQDIELFIGIPVTIWEQRTGWQHPRSPGNRDPAKRGYSTFLRDQCTYTDATNRPAACSKDYPADGRSTLNGQDDSWPVNHDQDWSTGGARPTPGNYNGKDTDWDIDSTSTDSVTPQFNSVRGAVAYSVENGFYLFPKGLGDAEIGLAFSPYSIARFNDARDSAMPSMRIEFKYQLPSGPLDTPGPRASRREKLGGTATNFDPGGTGTGLHRLNAAVSMSKRFKMVDPFATANYQLGIPQYYDRDAPERQFTDFAFWTHQVGGQFGVELVPLYYAPEVEEVVNLRVILAGAGTYFSRHRGPSEMSDVLNKWTMVDDYLQLMGRIGLVLAVPFVTFRALMEAGHETPHLLTGETRALARDVTSPKQNEVNPFYNPVLDAPGRRVKVSESVVVNGNLTLAITF